MCNIWNSEREVCVWGVFSFVPLDVQGACVRLPSGEREGSKSEERRGASAHTLHGQDGRNSEPLQRRHHCLPMWVIPPSGHLFKKIGYNMSFTHSSLSCSLYAYQTTESMFYLWVLIPVSVFPVIAAQPSSIPYLSALLPSELELQTLEETDSSEQDDQTDSENAAGNLINVSLYYWSLPSVWYSVFFYRLGLSLSSQRY